jgi:hypothetical protein
MKRKKRNFTPLLQGEVYSLMYCQPQHGPHDWPDSDPSHPHPDWEDWESGD